MKHLFEKSCTEEILNRIEKLSPTAKAQWGKMNVAQMITHCQRVIELAISDKKVSRSFMGLLFGKMVKPSVINEQPFKKNAPTDKNFLVTDERVFETEKAKLISLIKQFQEGGEAKISKHPHPFFGEFTASDWSRSQYKHLDHHLSQFGA